MIKVDESDPVGELEPSFPFKDITIRRGVDMKEHYELQSEIGRGKFGTVFKCREKATGLMLAAKFVGIVHKQDRRNVEREVEIMCELQHPRLIQLYDAFEANNAMCFILELVEGGELFERVIGDDFVLTEKAVTIFMRQICEGVQFIHSKNILHLDLKPENILCLTKTGNRIKIIDFGLARKFNPENKLQVLFGTPEFVAPEVVNFDAIGFGTDMWSVGVICYVLLSGLSPFMGETDVETMANVTIAQYDFDDEAFDSISTDAKDFIKKLLIKDHKSRPTATECLAHRWMQKKKPKKIMTRKNSSKKLLKQNTSIIEDKPKLPSVTSCNQDVLLMPLDVSKDNLKDLCSKSRSQSPVEIVTVSPNLAQLRIQKDCKSPRKTGNGDGPVNVTSNSSKMTNVTVLPSTSSVNCKISSDNSAVVRSISDTEQASLTTCASQASTSGTQQASTSGTHQSTTNNTQQLKTFNVQQTMAADIQQATTSDTQQTATSNPQPATTSEVQKATISSTHHQSTTSNAQQTATSDIHQVTTTNAQQASNLNSRQATISGVQRAITSEVQQTTPTAVDIPSASVHETTKWSMHQTTTTNENANNDGRRSSDISYMFSSFRTTCSTTAGTMLQSSNFLQSTDIRELSERLQNMHLSMFDDHPAAGPEVATGNLHKLLLNSKRLTTSSSFDRKPKFKLSALNRDVPAGSPPPASNLLYYMTTTSRSSSSCRSAPHSERTSPEHESSSAYKEMLLKLFYGGGVAAGENPVTTESKLST